MIFTWNYFLRFLSYSSDQVVKNYRNYHDNSNLISTWARCAQFFQPHVNANCKKSCRTWGGGAVSARKVARAVVKCSPTDSLGKIDAFWLLGRGHIFKTRSYSFITNAYKTTRQKAKNFQILKKFSNFQNWNFLKMHDIHTKLVSSLFKLE